MYYYFQSYYVYAAGPIMSHCIMNARQAHIVVKRFPDSQDHFFSIDWNPKMAGIFSLN